MEGALPVGCGTMTVGYGVVREWRVWCGWGGWVRVRVAGGEVGFSRALGHYAQH